MSVWRRTLAALRPGVYDEVVSEALEVRLADLALTHSVDLAAVSKDSDVDEQLVTLVRDAARIAIESRASALDKIAMARAMLAALENQEFFRDGETVLRTKVLRSITANVPGLPTGTPVPPRGSLLTSGLVTNAHGESVLAHLTSEFESADRIDLLVSFVKLSGLDSFRRQIERHIQRGRPLRVLTTTYMRATELKAIELLKKLGAEVRISYDEGTTRLHAKAWLFHRDSGYSTGFVGSSNLSHAAQTEGLEWNVRISQIDQPGLLEEMASVFESYWVDADRFEPFDGTDAASRRLARALSEPDRDGTFLGLQLEPKDWQKPILRELDDARALGRHKNLVVSATGTGKTLVAAFDYQRLRDRGEVDSLLFIAHRREILEQSRRVFREVLGLAGFAELWVDGLRPNDGHHVFASIQSLDRAAELAPDHFQLVIVDEVHHAAAKTYDDLLRHLKPLELVGLTATPERADGKFFEAHFPRPYVGNLRVWDAIQQQVLVPFRYFVLDVDGVDLSDVRWVAGGYVDSELSQRLISARDFWVRAVTRTIGEHVGRPKDVRALAFCVDKAHARVVAEELTRLGLSARSLTADTPDEERRRAKSDLLARRIQVLCVVDLFNEGVDIPDVNTLFLFRPTESTTVFLQQLGRGLRRAPDKDILTVLDVTGRQHPSFRFDRHLRELTGQTPRELREFVEAGSGKLPSGCVLQFEERAQQDIMERVARAIPSDLRGLRTLLQAHRDEAWTLEKFLEESEVDILDIYRQKRSWTSLRADVGIAKLPTDEDELAALENVQSLLHVSDSLRLDAWRRLLALEEPRTEIERRLVAMLFVVLYGPYVAAKFDERFAAWRSQATLREELRQLFPVLEKRADALPRRETLEPDVPLVVHGRYLDVELSVAFAAIATTSGCYRHFYTGVEKVGEDRYDMLLVTLDKAGQKHEHLQYKDFPLNEWIFQWQSKASTRADEPAGLRLIRPKENGAVPLLFAREMKKDERGVTQAFRYLGPVEPTKHIGERPITIDWKLGTPLLPEWVRRWGPVA
jgi:superfamily II DNA or RNA helicase/HKD family nuclease